MRVVFAGPSLHGEVQDGRHAHTPGVEIRGPASQGDIARAVLEGATVVGLVDGRYEDVAGPWHKEILHALSQGVRVFGAGSIGALRAVECEAFGMIGLGTVVARYRSGELSDDADVAQLHGPAELGWCPVTEARVNIDATLARMRGEGALAPALIARLAALSRQIFFKDLTIETLVAGCDLGEPETGRVIESLEMHRVDQKRADARMLLEAVRAAPAERATEMPAWQLATPPVWRRFMASVA